MAIDPIVASRAAEHMVLRTLLNELFVAICMREDDPVAEAKRRGSLSLNALDALAEQDADQMFMHSALHEMETFWKSVDRQVQGRVSAGLQR